MTKYRNGLQRTTTGKSLITQVMGRYSEGFLFRRFDHKDYYHITNPNPKKLTLNPRVLARSATLAYSEYRAADRACIANARAVGPGCIFRIENLWEYRTFGISSRYPSPNAPKVSTAISVVFSAVFLSLV